MKDKNFKNLFFQNIDIKQTIFKNTFWLAVSEGIFRFSQFLLIIYIIRILGVAEFGKFTFALAFVSIFVMLSDFGLSDITTREFSRDKENEKEYSAIISLKIFLSIGVLILILVGSFFITSDPVIQKVIWILAVFVLISNFFFIIYAFLRARQKMEYEAGVKILQALIMVGVGFFILFKFPSIENISWGYLVTNFIVLIFVLVFFHFRIQPLKLNLNKAVWQKFFKFSWPLGLASIFGAIFVNIDSVIMGYFGQTTQVGYYNAARRIVGFLIIPATLISVSFFPVLNKIFKESLKKLQRIWNFYMESMIVLSIPLVAGGLIFAPRIINFIYGQNFNTSIIALQILISIVGINFLYYPYILMLIISHQQKKILQINLIAVITNISLNFLLIPRYNLYGAAVASVITYIVFLILLVAFSKYFMPIPIFNLRLFKVLVIAILSSLIMVMVLKKPLIYNLNLLLIIITGILIYFTTLFLFYKLLYKLHVLVRYE